jgi:Tn7-like transposition protein D
MREGPSTPREKARNELQEKHRTAWLGLQTNDPTLTRSQLAAIEPNAYQWLIRNDGEWLNQHVPAKQASRGGGITVQTFYENKDSATSVTFAEFRDSINARAGRSELTYRDTDDPCDTGAAVCTIVLDGGAKLHIMKPDPNGDGPKSISLAATSCGRTFSRPRVGQRPVRRTALDDMKTAPRNAGHPQSAARSVTPLLDSEKKR